MSAISGLFVYGSLMFPEVLDAVLGRVPHAREARATGWRAAALRGRPFPGLVKADGTVGGRLLGGLTEKEATELDAFEGPMYDKVGIELDDGTRALVYACVDEALVLGHDWDPVAFHERELEEYLRRCAAWRATWTAGWQAGWEAARTAGCGG